MTFMVSYWFPKYNINIWPDKDVYALLLQSFTFTPLLYKSGICEEPQANASGFSQSYIRSQDSLGKSLDSSKSTQEESKEWIYG